MQQLNCPHCGAHLPPTDHTGQGKCPYCRWDYVFDGAGVIRVHKGELLNAQGIAEAIDGAQPVDASVFPSHFDRYCEEAEQERGLQGAIKSFLRAYRGEESGEYQTRRRADDTGSHDGACEPGSLAREVVQARSDLDRQAYDRDHKQYRRAIEPKGQMAPIVVLILFGILSSYIGEFCAVSTP